MVRRPVYNGMEFVEACFHNLLRGAIGRQLQVSPYKHGNLVVKLPERVREIECG
jgi:hypothetical protein